MSNFSTFGQVSEGLPGTAPNIFQASTPDNLAAITAVGYLNDISAKVKLNDRVYINYADTSVFPLSSGEASITGEFVVGYSASNWSLLPVSSQGLVASVAITAAQFNGMYAAPVLLLPAPGANKLIVVNNMQLVMTYVSANYAAGGVVAAQYDSTVHGAGVLATNSEAAADFQAAASTVFKFNGGVVLAPFATTVNKGLYLSNATGAFTTGDSTFVAQVNYNVIAVA